MSGTGQQRTFHEQRLHGFLFHVNLIRVYQVCLQQNINLVGTLLCFTKLVFSFSSGRKGVNKEKIGKKNVNRGKEGMNNFSFS